MNKFDPETNEVDMYFLSSILDEMKFSRRTFMKALCVDSLGEQWKRIEATRPPAGLLSLSSPNYYENQAKPEQVPCQAPVRPLF